MLIMLIHAKRIFQLMLNFVRCADIYQILLNFIRYLHDDFQIKQN